ncbi:hybrid sensor histidine kinase/response regulator [Hydrococcus rivularis NIES-593]|uniref:Circadian input-output histidine kinase CikA n=1 Tax=Hydrococcus rivularis NIES-593 TaxID=1921803 RepID=A0A1U7HMJ4_9CYAN|nr:response regulator [Hydrococcus rivularis]OKH24813.1 hybrid sensor histidine kinase/response regulator [Hydrococcus rivularis NIES-593]
MTLRFLLLEDSVLDMELIHALLTEGGIACELVRVQTRSEFETALAQHSYDSILSDYALPSFDGISALEIAQQLSPETPFIFVTATMGEEVAIETLKKGATDYVLKQRLERLVPSVKRALREAEERRARQQAEAELRQQKEELERVNRIKDEFIAILSHELRSPLNAILGWAQLLQTQKLDPANVDRAIETIARNAKLQTQLIEDLLDISRIIRGKIVLESRPINLAAVIAAAIDTVRLSAQAKAIELRFEYQQDETPTPLLVLGDPSRLQQIVWNLLTNAIKFTPDGGRVEVKLETGGRGRHLIQNSKPYAQITVTDTGKGISADFLPYIFDSFRQADGSTTRRFGGLGLGLAIVRHLVELHGGTISASSPGEEKGATFRIELPLLIAETSQNSTPDTPNPETSSPLANLRILVVDDDRDSSEFIAFLLEQSGAIATVAASVQSALQVFSSFHPDVLLSDIGMPEENGYSLIRKIRLLSPEQGGQIPAIALTAYARDQDRDEAIAAGFQLHLAKPVAPHDLIAAIKKVLDS